MATTPNYNFIMPDPTDLVTDLPADFEIFGDEVDLRVKALNPETTEGDLAYRGATADAKDRLGIGTAGQVLAVNSGATAPEWISLGAAGGGMTLISTIIASAATSISFTSIPSSFQHLLLIWEECFQNTSADDFWSARVNNDSTSVYRTRQVINGIGPTIQFSEGAVSTSWGNNSLRPIIGPTANGTDIRGNSYGYMFIYDYANTATKKFMSWQTSSHSVGGSDRSIYCDGQGVYHGSNSAIDRVDLIRNNTQTLTGTIKLYGV